MVSQLVYTLRKLGKFMNYPYRLWHGMSPVHLLVFLHHKDIICYLSSLLAKSLHFQLKSTVSTTFLLVKLMVIKHGRHVVSCLYWQPRGPTGKNPSIAPDARNFGATAIAPKSVRKIPIHYAGYPPTLMRQTLLPTGILC